MLVPLLVMRRKPHGVELCDIYKMKDDVLDRKGIASMVQVWLGHLLEAIIIIN